MVKRNVLWGGMALMVAATCGCSTTSTSSHKPRADRLVVSVDDQRLVVIDDGKPVKSYPVSTSKFGLGSRPRSNRTPLGSMYVHQKVGGGSRAGTVFKNRRPTGEVIRPNTPGRDPIVSRILWLEGKERSNSNTKERMIYIHGTPEERKIGSPASYGCIRMKSRDVIDLYDRVGEGTGVYVKRSHLKTAEIPSSDRRLMASARMRERPLGELLSGRGTEVLAAAAPQQRKVVTRTAPARVEPRRVTRTAPPRVETRRPEPAPARRTYEKPVRRGAFTRSVPPQATARTPTNQASSAGLAQRSR